MWYLWRPAVRGWVDVGMLVRMRQPDACSCRVYRNPVAFHTNHPEYAAVRDFVRTLPDARSVVTTSVEHKPKRAASELESLLIFGRLVLPLVMPGRVTRSTSGPGAPWRWQPTSPAPRG